MLRRSLVDLSRPLARSIKTDASKNVSTTHFKGEGSSSGKIVRAQERPPVSQEHLKHRLRMREKFPEGWNPPRKLSRETMEGIRVLHAQDSKTFSTPVLAERFRVSPEAMRRILRSKWVPSKAEKAKILEKDRRRKEENIEKSVLREKEALSEREEKSRQQRREEDDGFTLV